jgi:hypothetical protein
VPVHNVCNGTDSERPPPDSHSRHLKSHAPGSSISIEMTKFETGATEFFKIINFLILATLGTKLLFGILK